MKTKVSNYIQSIMVTGLLMIVGLLLVGCSEDAPVDYVKEVTAVKVTDILRCNGSVCQVHLCYHGEQFELYDANLSTITQGGLLFVHDAVYYNSENGEEVR